MIAETLILHAGDLIEWRDSSGFIGKPPQRIAPATLHIEIMQASKALRITNKPTGTLLWRKFNGDNAYQKIVAAMATELDLIAPVVANQSVTGRVSDPSGRFLPRLFTLTLGAEHEYKVALYQTPLGAPFTQTGGLYGQLGFSDGSLAAWALIQLIVTPSLGPPLTFVAQADAHGEFRLPLARLPALTKDAPALTYAAKLSVKAAYPAMPEQALDPDSLQTKKVATGKTGNGNSQFTNTLEFALAPGGITKIVSPNHALIVLQST